MENVWRTCGDVWRWYEDLPAGAYGGVLRRGAGLPPGVVPAAASAVRLVASKLNFQP
jgi:hypothetical protein